MIVFLYLLFTPFILFAGYNANDKSRMITDLEIIRNEIDINYAPADWKKNTLNWDLDFEILKARKKIRAAEPLTSRQYQQIIRDLFNSMQDLHVSVNFYSTEFAMLPFIVQGIDNRYFVVWTGSHSSEDSNIPLQVGDEILSFNGKPVAGIVREIQTATYGLCNNDSYRHLSEMQLTVREGNALQVVPQGLVEVVYKKIGADCTDSFLTEWHYIPEEIDQNSFQPLYKHSSPLGAHAFFHKCRTLPLYMGWQKHHSEARDAQFLGAKKSPFPALGPISWESNSSYFQAYVYSLKDKSIGYIRIADFRGDVEEVEDFRKIIEIMEGRTHILIIDVMNNPGGLAFYTYALISMLIDKPLQNLQEKMTITQEDVYFAIQDAEQLSEVETDEDAVNILGKDICGYIVDKEMAKSILNQSRFIRSQFNEGKFMTDLYPLEGIKYINPDRIAHYTKPILVLTNSLSISCGDLLPALFQDNQRAKILGSQTGGAGGYVLKKKYSNRFGVGGFTLTGSIIYREDGQPIENRGVKPDFPYEFSVSDYTNNYVDFIEYVNTVINKI